MPTASPIPPRAHNGARSAATAADNGAISAAKLPRHTPTASAKPRKIPASLTNIFTTRANSGNIGNAAPTALLTPTLTLIITPASAAAPHLRPTHHPHVPLAWPLRIEHGIIGDGATVHSSSACARLPAQRHAPHTQLASCGSWRGPCAPPPSSAPPTNAATTRNHRCAASLEHMLLRRDHRRYES